MEVAGVRAGSPLRLRAPEPGDRVWRRRCRRVLAAVLADIQAEAGCSGVAHAELGSLASDLWAQSPRLRSSFVGTSGWGGLWQLSKARAQVSSRKGGPSCACCC